MEKSERKKLERKLRPILANICSFSIYQERPYTCVVTSFVVVLNKTEKGDCLEASGFSKVCYPDQWDNAFGIEIAFHKSVANLAKKIVGLYPEYAEKVVSLNPQAVRFAYGLYKDEHNGQPQP